MGISIFRIKRWFLMLSGNSISHVKQSPGLVYSKNGIEGYYNDLTQKVLQGKGELLPSESLENGEKLTLPIEVFQYGLGAYDLLLTTGEERYQEIFYSCVDWAVENISPNGAWNSFFFIYPDNPFSSMAQGEGVSLLLRAYVHSGKYKYFELAKQALGFMLQPLENGGTSRIRDGEWILMEYTHLAPVLNGWVFSLFGIYDYLKIDEDERIQKILDNNISSIASKLKDFDAGYWSKYDDQNTIASPFYHELHISLLAVLFDLFGIKEFLEYSEKFKKYKKNPFFKVYAFVKKAIQKIKE